MLALAAPAFLLLAQCSTEPEPSPAEPIAVAPLAEPLTVAPPVEPIAADESGTGSAPARDLATTSRQRDLVEAIKSWLGAWSEQRVEDYLDHYSESFTPSGGLSRGQWEDQRWDRVSAPRFVRVTMTGLETELLGTERARATFFQHYRSDGFTDTVRKTLELVWEDGRWRIIRESSESTR